MTGTGLLLAYRLHGSPGGRALIIGMDRHEWGNVHLWISYIAVVAVLAHLIMNWTWLKDRLVYETTAPLGRLSSGYTYHCCTRTAPREQSPTP